MRRFTTDIVKFLITAVAIEFLVTLVYNISDLLDFLLGMTAFWLILNKSTTKIR